MNASNFFANIPSQLPNEIIETIVNAKSCNIERIISRGHTSPEDFWYDQARNEWVIVLQGHARLRFEKDNKIVTLSPGDYMNIPAHCKHRVEWTDPDEETVWLAVHY